MPPAYYPLQPSPLLMNPERAYYSSNNKQSPSSNFNFAPQDLVALKIQGLPFQISTQDIYTFFTGYAYLQNSAFLGMN